MFYEINLSLNDFSENAWRVYFAIASGVLKSDKNVLDEVTISFYLEKHKKLKDKYDEYGGYETISKAMAYVKEENIFGYIEELKKWNSLMVLVKYGLFDEDRLSDYEDMTSEEIYEMSEAYLNEAFANADGKIKSYNALSGLKKLVKKLNEGKGVGLPFHNCKILNRETGGFNARGNIYGLGASSGVGKTTTAINYLVPSILEYDEKIVFFINEQDQEKVQEELLIWVANNHFNRKLPKYEVRDGNFSEETNEILLKSAEWLESKQDSRNITVIPLERYSVNTVVKLIKKYASMGVGYFVLDTLKESSDASTDETYKSLMRDMVKLYDVVKPASKNVGLFVTYQLGKASIKMRYLTNNEIGLGKSIVDVMSVNLMMRRPFDDEYSGGAKEIVGYKLEGKNGKTKIPFKLDRTKKYMILFLPKNRFGVTDPYQIVSEYDMSTNTYKDIGICNIIPDF